MTYESLLYSTYEQEKTTAGSKQAHIPSMTQANDEVGVELRVTRTFLDFLASKLNELHRLHKTSQGSLGRNDCCKIERLPFNEKLFCEPMATI